MWLFTVASLMKSAAPISTFDFPLAISTMTECSRGVMAASRASDSRLRPAVVPDANRLMSDFATVGERIEPPTATVETASTEREVVCL